MRTLCCLRLLVTLFPLAHPTPSCPHPTVCYVIFIACQSRRTALPLELFPCCHVLLIHLNVHAYLLRFHFFVPNGRKRHPRQRGNDRLTGAEKTKRNDRIILSRQTYVRIHIHTRINSHNTKAQKQTQTIHRDHTQSTFPHFLALRYPIEKKKKKCRQQRHEIYPPAATAALRALSASRAAAVRRLSMRRRTLLMPCPRTEALIK